MPDEHRHSSGRRVMAELTKGVPQSLAVAVAIFLTAEAPADDFRGIWDERLEAREMIGALGPLSARPAGALSCCAAAFDEYDALFYSPAGIDGLHESDSPAPSSVFFPWTHPTPRPKDKRGRPESEEERAKRERDVFSRSDFDRREEDALEGPVDTTRDGADAPRKERGRSLLRRFSPFAGAIGANPEGRKGATSHDASGDDGYGGEERNPASSPPDFAGLIFGRRTFARASLFPGVRIGGAAAVAFHDEWVEGRSMPLERETLRAAASTSDGIALGYAHAARDGWLRLGTSVIYDRKTVAFGDFSPGLLSDHAGRRRRLDRDGATYESLGAVVSAAFTPPVSWRPTLVLAVNNAGGTRHRNISSIKRASRKIVEAEAAPNATPWGSFTTPARLRASIAASPRLGGDISLLVAAEVDGPVGSEQTLGGPCSYQRPEGSSSWCGSRRDLGRSAKESDLAEREKPDFRGMIELYAGRPGAGSMTYVRAAASDYDWSAGAGLNTGLFRVDISTLYERTLSPAGEKRPREIDVSYILGFHLNYADD